MIQLFNLGLFNLEFLFSSLSFECFLVLHLPTLYLHVSIFLSDLHTRKAWL